MIMLAYAVTLLHINYAQIYASLIRQGLPEAHFIPTMMCVEWRTKAFIFDSLSFAYSLPCSELTN